MKTLSHSGDVCLSVVVPAYEVSNVLQRTLESIWEAAPDKTEVVVAVDKSADNTAEVAYRLAAQDCSDGRRTLVVEHADRQNHGAAETRNLGMGHASGEFLSFLDADDYYLPNRFKMDLPLLRKQSGLDAVIGATSVVCDTDAEGDLWGDQHIFLSAQNPDRLVASVSQGKCWHFNALTLRRSTLARVGFLNPRLRLGQDVEWFIRIAAVLNVADSGDVPVAAYRRHGANRAQFGRYEHMILVVSSAVQWLRSHGQRDKAADVLQHYLQTAYSASQGMLERGENSRQRRFLRQLALAFPSVLKSRLFWTRMCQF